MDENKELIEEIIKLSELVAVSSREKKVRDHIIEQFVGTDYSTSVDNLGNLILQNPEHHCGEQSLLLFAHMDEIGMIVRKIEGNGYLRFERLGGVNTQILPGTRILIDGDKGLLPGVIGVQSHHFMPAANKFQVPPITDMYIDCGASSAEEVINMGIKVGTIIALDANCRQINGRYIQGKALDNRVAIAVIEQVAKKLDMTNLDYKLIICFPVMEEYNIRGLMPVYRKYKPTVAIGVDITPACDTPDLDYNDIALGQGPAVCCMNFHGGGTLAGVMPDARLLATAEAVANQLQIGLQREISPGIITENAFGLFENEEGIRVLNLSIPTRYTHTPIEMVSTADAAGLIKLLSGILQQPFGEI